MTSLNFLETTRWAIESCRYILYNDKIFPVLITSSDSYKVASWTNEMITVVMLKNMSCSEVHVYEDNHPAVWTTRCFCVCVEYTFFSLISQVCSLSLSWLLQCWLHNAAFVTNSFCYIVFQITYLLYISCTVFKKSPQTRWLIKKDIILN